MFGTKFSNMNLSESEYEFVNMNNIRIGDCEIAEAEFEGPSLKGSKFISCDLTNVEIKDCNIDGLIINGIDISELLKQNGKL